MKNIYEKPLVAMMTFDNMDSTNVNTASIQGTTSTVTKDNTLTKINFGNFK